MKHLHFESTTTLNFTQPVTNHYFLLRTIPANYAGQFINSYDLMLEPNVPFTLSKDSFGNINAIGRITFPHTEFVYSVSGTATIDLSKNIWESLNPIYKYPSFYTHLDDAMICYARSLNLQGSTLDKSIQLANELFHYMNYVTGSTTTATTAMDAFHSKKGVCQDYAHIFIALSRYLGIPARYANGVPLGTGPTHAWVEIYDHGIWIGIDPTHNRLVEEDYVRFCTGRDFRDCALERGTLVGNSFQFQNTTTEVIEQ